MQPRHDRVAGLVGHQQLVGEVVELAAGVAEVLARLDLVTGQDRHGEAATGDQQRVGVVLGRHGRHDDRLAEADLGHPVRGVGAWVRPSWLAATTCTPLASWPSERLVVWSITGPSSPWAPLLVQRSDQHRELGALGLLAARQRRTRNRMTHARSPGRPVRR